MLIFLARKIINFELKPIFAILNIDVIKKKSVQIVNFSDQNSTFIELAF